MGTTYPGLRAGERDEMGRGAPAVPQKDEESTVAIGKGALKGKDFLDQESLKVHSTVTRGSRGANQTAGTCQVQLRISLCWKPASRTLNILRDKVINLCFKSKGSRKTAKSFTVLHWRASALLHPPALFTIFVCLGFLGGFGGPHLVLLVFYSWTWAQGSLQTRMAQR